VVTEVDDDLRWRLFDCSEGGDGERDDRFLTGEVDAVECLPTAVEDEEDEEDDDAVDGGIGPGTWLNELS
jgi:hypothetical protein